LSVDDACPAGQPVGEVGHLREGESFADRALQRLTPHSSHQV